MANYVEALVEEIQKHGVTEWFVDEQHKRPQIRFSWRGRELAYTTSRSPSDRRGLVNAFTSLRRVMGVSRVIVKSESGPRRRNRTVEAAAPTSFTVRPDPFAVLAAMRGEDVA